MKNKFLFPRILLIVLPDIKVRFPRIANCWVYSKVRGFESYQVTDEKVANCEDNGVETL